MLTLPQCLDSRLLPHSAAKLFFPLKPNLSSPKGEKPLQEQSNSLKEVVLFCVSCLSNSCLIVCAWMEAHTHY